MPEVVEKALVAKLGAVVTTVDSRVYPVGAEQGEVRSRLVYQKKDAEKIGRDLTGPGRLNKAVFQVDAYSNGPAGYSDVKSIEALMVPEDGSAGLDGNVGVWTFTGGTIFVQACRVENNLDELAPPRFAESTSVYSISFNVTVVYEIP